MSTWFTPKSRKRYRRASTSTTQPCSLSFSNIKTKVECKNCYHTTQKCFWLEAELRVWNTRSNTERSASAIFCIQRSNRFRKRVGSNSIAGYLKKRNQILKVVIELSMSIKLLKKKMVVSVIRVIKRRRALTMSNKILLNHVNAIFSYGLAQMRWRKT